MRRTCITTGPSSFRSRLRLQRLSTLSSFVHSAIFRSHSSPFNEHVVDSSPYIPPPSSTPLRPQIPSSLFCFVEPSTLTEDRFLLHVPHIGVDPSCFRYPNSTVSLNVPTSRSRSHVKPMYYNSMQTSD